MFGWQDNRPKTLILPAWWQTYSETVLICKKLERPPLQIPNFITRFTVQQIFLRSVLGGQNGCSADDR